MIYVKFTAFCSRLANPFGHPSQVRTQVLVLQTCVDLRRLASPFGQGLSLYTVPAYSLYPADSWTKLVKRWRGDLQNPAGRKTDAMDQIPFGIMGFYLFVHLSFSIGLFVFLPYWHFVELRCNTQHCHNAPKKIWFIFFVVIMTYISE